MKQAEKERRLTNASSNWKRTDPWDKRLLRDVRDYVRILFDKMFHRQLKRERMKSVRTLLRFMGAPVWLMVELRDSWKIGRQWMDELIDFVYREPRYKYGLKHEVMVYRKFKKETVQQFKDNPFIKHMVQFFNRVIFEEYTQKLALPKLRKFMRTRLLEYL